MIVANIHAGNFIIIRGVRLYLLLLCILYDMLFPKWIETRINIPDDFFDCFGFAYMKSCSLFNSVKNDTHDISKSVMKKVDSSYVVG